MALIHEYLVGLARRLSADGDVRLLDYGCGAGEVVQLASGEGFDAYGVDLFYEGGSFRAHAEDTGLLGNRILEIKHGVIPFDDHRFDVVVSNQVFEHIDDFRTPLDEISRVLRPGGVFINLFPSDEVWREGHIGIPFAHWFAKGSPWRQGYTLCLRSLGMGHNKHRTRPLNWTRVNLEWIDQWTFYKSVGEIRSLFQGYFTIDEYAADYLVFRVARRVRLSWMAFWMDKFGMQVITEFLCRRLSGHVFVLRKFDMC